MIYSFSDEEKNAADKAFRNHLKIDDDDRELFLWQGEFEGQDWIFVTDLNGYPIANCAWRPDYGIRSMTWEQCCTSLDLED